MSDPVDKKKRATYQDVLDAPEHKVAEIINGTLHVSPRPAQPHTRVASSLGYVLGPPFDRGNGGPGGWIILAEPELHLGDDVLVPDLAGWRRERMPMIADESYFTLPPDWICEVLSKSTAHVDRMEKMPIYAASGVQFAWLVNPRARTLEAYRLGDDGRFVTIATYDEHARARIEPLDAIELDLARLWADLPLPTRASEVTAFDYW
jgi:Uma2 family endonuclease